MSSDKRTRDYVTRQVAKGRSKMEILRLLKRALAREVFRLLTTVCEVDDYSDLRPARQHKNITLTAVAQHFGSGPPSSPGWNAGCNATTPSPLTTDNGSPPPERPSQRRLQAPQARDRGLC